MPDKNAVLALEREGDVQRLSVALVDETNIPEMLNGESEFHIYHVRMLTELILDQMKRQGLCALSDEDVQAIAMASSLHDVGKSQIPKSILDFPGKLSPVEYDIVKKHAVFGETIINELDFGDMDPKIRKYAAEIARAHHERYDGTGYPEGLKGDAIPLAAQVVSLADAYDALTSSRSYKDAFSQDVAVQMISSGMCGVFNEVLVDCLLKVVNHSALAALRETLAKKRTVVASGKSLVPERVLCIGNTQYVTKDFLAEAFPNSKVMVIGNTELGSADKIKLFRIKKPSVKAVLETYDFDLIVFFSGDLTFHTTEKNDAEELREVLEYAKQMQKNSKIIFLSSLDAAFSQRTDRGILSAAKENLCQFYAKSGALDIKIVQIPYMLIVQTAKILTETFKSSVIFHIGGDEFAVILQDEDYKQYHTLIRQMDKACEADCCIAVGEDDVVPVSVARGVSLFDPSIARVYEDVFAKADRAMYINKEEIKAAVHG